MLCGVLKRFRATWFETEEHPIAIQKTSNRKPALPYLAEDIRKISPRHFNYIFTACQELKLLICESHVDLTP